ncbi:hypothetical protein QW71_34330 [Paenibacillus sp. IHB B 3415]|nr:hypothetical protein QW71_34330 [Paenibacillus sp. IHB B 3415]
MLAGKGIGKLLGFGAREATDTEVRYLKGKVVTAMEKTYEMALNPNLYANEIAKKYGINLKGSGKKIEIMFNADLKALGISRKANPNVIEVGPQAFVDEATLANTIAHELNHARSWLKGVMHLRQQHILQETHWKSLLGG